MIQVDIKQWSSRSIKDPKNAGNEKAAQECALYYNASVVKGFIRRNGVITTHYFNKMHNDYYTILLENDAEYFVETAE